MEARARFHPENRLPAGRFVKRIAKAARLASDSAFSMATTSPSGRTAVYKPELFLFAFGAVVVTGLLLFAGGFTTSIGAGMAFLDWPLSNGSVNPEGWMEDPAMRAEHSHRLLGATVGLITIGIAVWLWRRESRAWLRRLGWIAVALVVFQGVLGGLRVLLDSMHIDMVDTSAGRLFAMGHATLAQAFLCLLVAIAAGCSRSWINGVGPAGAPAPTSARRWAVAAVALIFVQLMIAAVMRHSHAGLAIPWFPTSPSGALLPEAWDFRVAIHFAHRAMALVLFVALAGLALKVWRDADSTILMRRIAGWIIGLVSLQIMLGAAVISSFRHPHVTTWHVLVGAATLALTALLALFLFRDRIEGKQA
jgi:cytochrome c oxidase assembly protein subunit 15